MGWYRAHYLQVVEPLLVGRCTVQATDSCVVNALERGHAHSGDPDPAKCVARPLFNLVIKRIYANSIFRSFDGVL